MHRSLLPSCALSSTCCNHFLSCVRQRYQGRKRLADRARAGKASRLRLCFHRLSCELLCWDSILVGFKTCVLMLRSHCEQPNYRTASHGEQYCYRVMVKVSFLIQTWGLMISCCINCVIAAPQKS